MEKKNAKKTNTDFIGLQKEVDDLRLEVARLRSLHEVEVSSLNKIRIVLRAILTPKQKKMILMSKKTTVEDLL